MLGVRTINLQRARDWADLFLKFLSMLAIIAGAAWAYFQFMVTNTTASNIQLTVSTETHHYSPESRLLLIHAKPKNIGKVPVTPANIGFLIDVRVLPNNAKFGALDLESLPEFYKTDLLKRFPDGYLLEPGVEYDEVLALVVPVGSMYAVKSTLNLEDNTEVDHTTVVRVE